MFLQNGKLGSAGADVTVGVSVIMLGTGKQPRGKKPKKHVKKSCDVSNLVSFKNSGECGRRRGRGGYLRQCSLSQEPDVI